MKHMNSLPINGGGPAPLTPRPDESRAEFLERARKHYQSRAT
jgi:hypothetical protein